jgi:hypothetical protein
MSTSMVDLSSLQQVNFGGGQTGYLDPGSNTFYDSGGNVLSGSDLSQYGAFTVTAPGSTPLPVSSPSPVSVSGSGNGASLAGMSSIFGGIATGIVNAMRPPTLPSSSGTLVYNPATGAYQSSAALTAGSLMSPLILLLLGGVVIWLIVREA